MSSLDETLSLSLQSLSLNNAFPLDMPPILLETIQLKRLPQDLKFLIAPKAIDLRQAAVKGLVWVFCEPSIYPINKTTELAIIGSLSRLRDLKYLKIFEKMLQFGGVTEVMHDAIYYAAGHGNKPMAHWFYENINKKCTSCTNNAPKSALLGALVYENIDYINYVINNYTEGCRPRITNDFAERWMGFESLSSEWLLDNYVGVIENDLITKSIKKNNSNLFKLLYQRYPGIFNGASYYLTLMIDYMRIELAQWYYENNQTIVLGELQLIKLIQSPVYMELIRWFHDAGALANFQTIMFSEACEAKNIEMLDFLHEIRAPMYMYKTHDYNLAMWLMKHMWFRYESGDIVDAIFRDASYPMIIFYLDYYTEDIKPNLLELLLKREKLHVAKYLHAIDPSQKLTPQIWNVLLMHTGNIEIYKWVVENKLAKVPDHIFEMVLKSSNRSVQLLNLFHRSKIQNKKVLIKLARQNSKIERWIEEHDNAKN